MRGAKQKRVSAVSAPALPGRLLTYQEAADVLKVHPATVRRLVYDGELERVSLNHQTIRIEEAKLALYISGHSGIHKVKRRTRKAA